ncbi:MAG: GtrA family protein [Candidatus Methylomirabilia bacterium]
MTATGLLTLSPLCGLVTYVGFHLSLCRFGLGGRQMTLLIVGGFAGLATTTVAVLLALAALPTVRNPNVLLLFNDAIFLALAWCYFHFVNLNIASLRIRLLQEFHKSPEGMAEAEVLARYGAAHVLDNRLLRLTSGGHLVEREGRYYSGTPFFLILFELFEVLKRIVMGKGNSLVADLGEPYGRPLSTLLRLVSRLWGTEFFRFLLVGVGNTVFSYLLFAAFILLGIDYRATVTLCTVITIIWNFNTTGRIVFRNRDGRLIFKFLAVYGIIYLINLGSLVLLVESGAGPLASQAVVVPVIAFISFLLNRRWVFGEARRIPNGR